MSDLKNMGKKTLKKKTGKGKKGAVKAAKRIKKKRAHPRQPPTNLRKRKDWVPAFLKEYAKHGNASKAAYAVGKDRQTVYDLKRINPEFSAKMDECFDALTDKIEESVTQHAFEGYDEPVFWDGEIVGYKRKYAPAERIFMLKKRKRDRYSDDVNEADGDPTEQAREAFEHLKLMEEQGFVPPDEGDA